MNQLLVIALGGALGAALRFLTALGAHRLLGRTLPYGVLTANVLGCFVMGVLATLFIERLQLGPLWRAGVLIGFLGSYTTFSSFTIDAMNLIEFGHTSLAMVYIALTLLLTLSATWIGILLGRMI